MNKIERKHLDAVTDDVSQKLIFMKMACADVGLFKTVKEIDGAIRQIGWEHSEKITGKVHKIKA